MACYNAPVLQTERTVLRPFDMGDADELLRVFRDPGVKRFLLDDTLVDLAWVRNEILASDSRFLRSGTGLWAARVENESPIVGFVGFRPFFDPPELQLLYGLLPEFWGRGLATEIAKAARDHAFRVLGLTTLTAATDIPNQKSARVLERLGMREERVNDEGRSGTGFYRLEREEWEANEERS